MPHRHLVLNVLGPLIVADGGREIRVARGMSTRLLLLLAIHRGSVVADHDLVRALWGDDARSLSPLRTAMMRLRNELPGAVDAVVERVPPGYRLRRQVHLDADVLLDALVGAADLTDALSLVRGVPFADVADEPWARSSVEEWTERILAVEDRHAAELASGKDPAGVAVLRRYATQQPEREVRWAHLVRLLDAVGRRAEALRVMREARASLGVFGLSPGLDLREIEAQILTDGPLAETGLVGRDADLVDVSCALVDRVTLVLTGIGGVGKTRLAEEIALRWIDEGGRAVFVDLTDLDCTAGLGVVESVLSEAAGLSRSDLGGLSVLETFAVSTRTTSTLLVLDNAEHLPTAVAGLVGALRDLDAPVTVLITSRDPLDLAGAVTKHVAPLLFPDETATLEECAASPAVQLLARLAPRAASDLHAAGRIARAVAGLPLGIELAAGLVRNLPVGDVADGLDAHLDRLDHLDPDLDDDDTSRRRLDHALAHSIDRLHRDDRALLCSLSVLAAPFTAPTAAALTGTSGGSPPVGGLSRLVTAGLLHVHRPAREGIPATYSLLPVQRAAATTALSLATRDALWDRAVDWYRQLAAANGARLRHHDQRRALRILQAEYRNLRIVLDRLLFSGRTVEVLDIVWSTIDYWSLAERSSEAARIAGDVLALHEAGDPLEAHDLARALLLPGATATTVADRLAHHETTRGALELLDAIQTPDAVLHAEARVHYAFIESWAGRGDVGIPLLFSAAANDDARVGTIARTVLAAGIVTHDPARGLAAIEEVSQACRARGDDFAEATLTVAVSYLLRSIGRFDDAARLLRRGIELAQGDLPSIDVHARYLLALTELDLGDADGDAVERLRALGTRLRLAGDIVCAAGCRRHIASSIRHTEGDAVALALLRTDLTLVARLDEQELAGCLLGIAEIYVDDGRRTAAGTIAQAARILATGTGTGWTVRDGIRLDALQIDSDITAGTGVDRAERIADAVRLALYA